jgi:hypothetical protein
LCEREKGLNMEVTLTGSSSETDKKEKNRKYSFWSQRTDDCMLMAKAT